MGGEQAATVMTEVGQPERSAPSSATSTSARATPYYSTARLWDDGVIDPVDTRRVLGLALGACANAPRRGGVDVRSARVRVGGDDDPQAS